MKFRILAVIALMLLGCANPYKKFYHDQTGGVDLTKSPSVILSTEEPKLFSGTEPTSDYVRMLEDGFGLVGYSSFNGRGNINVKAALKQATRVHAAVVIVYSKYRNTVSGALPLTEPDIRTSTTRVSGNVITSGRMGTYSGTAYSTTYGWRTTYIPYSVDRYDYFASYWMKRIPGVFGCEVRELSPQLRQTIGSNKGVVVIAVRKDSVAWNNDIVGGDVIRRIGDLEVIDKKSYHEAVRRYAGRRASVTFLRDGKEFTKEVVLDRGR